MSFIIRGGYDVLRKQVLNISLKYSDKWSRGLVMVQQNYFVSNIVPLDENKLEMVKYQDRHALLLNNTIIYEDKKLFTYKLDLQGFKELDINDPTLYDFIDVKYVDYVDLKRIESRWRTLN